MEKKRRRRGGEERRKRRRGGYVKETISMMWHAFYETYMYGTDKVFLAAGGDSWGPGGFSSSVAYLLSSLPSFLGSVDHHTL